MHFYAFLSLHKVEHDSSIQIHPFHNFNISNWNLQLPKNGIQVLTACKLSWVICLHCILICEMTGRYVTQKVSNFWKPMLSHNSFFYRKQSLLPPCYALSNVKYFDAFSIRSRRTKRSLQQQYVVWGCTHLWELLTQRKLRTVSHHHIIENISHKNETLKWDFWFCPHKLTTITKG